MKASPSHLVFLALTVLLAGPGRLWAHSAVEPAPRNDASWQERHKLINQRVAEAGDKAQVIFIGDSITQGWEGGGKEVWARYYAHRNAVNLGIGGDRTQHVLWRFENGNLNGLKPKVAVVMIGTNNSGGEDNTPSQIADGVAAIVKALRNQLPDTKILLVAIFPRSENPSPQRGKVLQVNQILRRLADDRTVFWADFGHQFLNREGIIPPDLMPDYLHLSPKGYQLWAEAIEDKLAAGIGDARVTPMTADVSGDWTWLARGPESRLIEIPFTLKADGDRLTGRFARGEKGWLDLEAGKITGNEFTCVVKRDRPDGSVMTYRIAGKFVDGHLVGTAKTEMDGQEIPMEWTALKQ